MCITPGDVGPVFVLMGIQSLLQQFSLKKQVNNLQAKLTRKEEEFTTAGTKLKTARENESKARKEKADAVKNAEEWQAYAGRVEKERDDLREKYEPPEPAPYSSPSP